MKRALIVVVVAAGLLTACLPPPPPPVPTVTKGFDACTAPSVGALGAWKASSPYSSVGVYIGGANRACAQPNLNRAWVGAAWSQGWGIIPIWVGAQAPCTALGSTTKIVYDPGWAFIQGAVEASAPADAADVLGFGWLAAIYYDMEGYPRGGACSQAVASFTDGWIAGLNRRGYLAGMYSSLCSGILDQAAAVTSGGHSALNAIWIAAWNNRPEVFGFGPPCALSDSLWSNHARLHQYTGGHNESYGGVTINIDSNAVDGPLAR